MPMRPFSRWLLALSVTPFLATAWQGGGTPKPKSDFDRDVVGVFKAYCISCHEGGEQAPAGLDLSTVAGIKKGGRSGPLFVPGKPDESLLVQRVLGMHGLTQMPKGFAPLSSAKVDGLKSWIAEGGSTKATGSKHWAYVTPKRPPAPVGKNPIDAMVGMRLKREGLRFSEEATREKLIRRASLDLIGLPPTLEEIDAFVQDKSPKAYDKVIDRLLASPHYGERQARIWLDLARYADTNGYEADRSRTAYLYRDWVIKAFNKNMRYDQFSIEQLAGDLFPGASLDQRIATGFHRNSMFNEEGGVDADESMFETILDRVGTTSTVWMGSTMACARCHDHKFDPFSQKDFYRMYAFFANNRYETIGDAKVGQRKFYEPTLKVPTPEQSAQVRKLKEQLSAYKRKLTDSNTNRAFQEWLTGPVDPGVWKPAVPTSAVSTGGATLTISADGLISASGANPDNPVYDVDLPVANVVGAIRIEPLPDPKMVDGGPGRSSGGNFVLSTVKVAVDGTPVLIKAAVSDFSQGGYEPFNLLGVSGGLTEGVWAAFPQNKVPHQLIISFGQPFKGKSMKVALAFASVWKQHAFSQFKISVSESPQAGLSGLPANFALLKSKANRSGPETASLREYFEKANPVVAVHRVAVSQTQAELLRVEAMVPSALVLVEKPSKGPLEAAMHGRGEFLSKGEMVRSGTPDFLPAPTSGNRIALAKWLFSKEHPLTARVQVNRMWAQYFGRGLVETEEDFGTQGSPPSHPELLDWLACELRDSGWDLKHIHRLIVSSATYRQSSNCVPALRRKDPENILLARGPRFRMEAEMIRDTALRASGLLNPKIGGPSVMPYQPEGIWDSPYSGEAWKLAEGKERYRRGLYVFWKRTAPFPSFMALDASSKEMCAVRRIRTNTPLQALALMNDKAYVEAAVALARSTSGSKSDKERVSLIFKRCTSRTPKPEEAMRLVQLASKLRRQYAKSPGEAQKLLAEDHEKGERPRKRESDVDLAAWTMVASVVLNLDESITKD